MVPKLFERIHVSAASAVFIIGVEERAARTDRELSCASMRVIDRRCRPE